MRCTDNGRTLARMAARRDPVELFWSKVDKSGDCWLWLAGKDKNGYGKFDVTLPRGDTPVGVKTPQRYIRAHHFAFETVHGPVAKGTFLMHSCDNPACVRPDHLSIGDPKANYHDSKRKGRNTRGERNAKSVLTDALVRVMRSEAAHGMRCNDIARKYGVKFGAVYFMLKGKTWRHVA